jgi:hypothetical protein
VQPYTAYISNDGCLEVVDATCVLLYSSTLTPGKGSPGTSSKQKPLPIFGFEQQAQLASNKTTGAQRSGSITGFTRAPPKATPSANKPTNPSGKTMPAKKSPKVPKPKRASPTAKFKSSPAQAKTSPPGQANASLTAGASARACALAHGALCGGINHCGLDQTCAARGCCAGVLACRRDNEFSWRCQ